MIQIKGKKAIIKESIQNRKEYKSIYYQRYFKGYTEIVLPKAGKGSRVERIYTSPWKLHDLTERQWIGLKLEYVIALLGILFSYFMSLTIDAGSNYASYVEVPGVLTAFFLLVLSFHIVIYISEPRKMTVGQYEESSMHMKKVLDITQKGMGSTIFLKIMYQTLHIGNIQIQEGYSIGLLCLSLFFSVWIYRKEKNIVYINVPNTCKIPEGGKEIGIDESQTDKRC